LALTNEGKQPDGILSLPDDVESCRFKQTGQSLAEQAVIVSQHNAAASFIHYAPQDDPTGMLAAGVASSMVLP